MSVIKWTVLKEEESYDREWEKENGINRKSTKIFSEDCNLKGRPER